MKPFASLIIGATLLYAATANAQMPPKTKTPAPKKAVSAAPKTAKTQTVSPPPIAKIFGILPGMTRADVEKVYPPAGGAFDGFRQSFLCDAPPPDILSLPFRAPFAQPSRTPKWAQEWKFDVVFTAPNQKADHNLKFVVVSVSEPYLGTAYAD